MTQRRTVRGEHVHGAAHEGRGEVIDLNAVKFLPYLGSGPSLDFNQSRMLFYSLCNHQRNMKVIGLNKVGKKELENNLKILHSETFQERHVREARLS